MITSSILLQVVTRLYLAKRDFYKVAHLPGSMRDRTPLAVMKAPKNGCITILCMPDDVRT
jgi:hypothetical protein